MPLPTSVSLFVPQGAGSRRPLRTFPAQGIQDSVTSESAVGSPRLSAGKLGSAGVLAKVAWSALILQPHCLPELRLGRRGSWG